VHAEDLLVDDGCDWQTVETVRERLPQLDVVASLAFVVKSIDSVDGGALVVAAEDEEVFGVFDLVSEEEADGFEGLLASIHIVAQEQIVGLRWKPSILEQPQQIIVLPVDVSADFDGGLKFEEDRLADENFSRFLTKPSDFLFCQVHCLSRSLTSHLQKSLDDVVHVDIHVSIC